MAKDEPFFTTADYKAVYESSAGQLERAMNKVLPTLPYELRSELVAAVSGTVSAAAALAAATVREEKDS